MDRIEQYLKSRHICQSEISRACRKIKVEETLNKDVYIKKRAETLIKVY